jgi:2-polyprenyl-6-methoxyphenol hydroxylase-like FAD-dependent oxidoreductase
VDDFDVVIAGAGPAGCAAAISLADFAPELRVCLIDPGLRGSDKIGDTVPPSIAPILRHLGMWGRFVADGHLPVHRSRSAWGRAELASNEYLLLGGGTGWQLDRPAFDMALLENARCRVAHFAQDKVMGLAALGRGLRIKLKTSIAYASRCAIDATGRAAVLSRLTGSPIRVDDRLVAVVAHVADPVAQDHELLVETFSDGWWYTAALPHGRRIVACMTDTDAIRRLELGSPQGFRRRFCETRHLRALLDDAARFDRSRLCPAGSSQGSVPSRLPVLQVGDAALALDPICGQGIVNALRTGIFASYAVAEWLRGRTDNGLRKYRSLIDGEYRAYYSARRDFYAAEARWPAQPFWRRRRPA